MKWKDVRAQAVAAGHLDEQRVAQHKAKMLAQVQAHQLDEGRLAKQEASAEKPEDL